MTKQNEIWIIFYSKKEYKDKEYKSSMQLYLKEKIGNPELFSGRKKEMGHFLKWIDNIKTERSKSTAILARKKTGKSAIMQRLYNITFEKNDIVVPFYYEIKESPQWVFDFSKDFLLNFIYQYLAFKIRKKNYNYTKKTFANALDIADKEGLDHLVGLIETALEYIKDESIDMLWDIARDAPRKIAEYNDERVVQLIDEFQLLSRYIYRDKECTLPARNFIGSWLHTVEYKIAPLLVSGSWVGWLMQDLNRMLPGRVKRYKLGAMPEDEAFEMILKYSHILEAPITEEIAVAMTGLTEGNPCYISALFDSDFEGRDFTIEKGLMRTLEYEVKNDSGDIFNTWMEYVHSALDRINDTNGKKIVLYLSKNREREMSRKDIMNDLKLDMTERGLEKKLHALAYSDIIEYGRSNFYYRGVPDNIFDKVFRSVYADDVQEFDPMEITNEYKERFEELMKKYNSLSGEYNHYKGIFTEFLIIDHLRYRAYENQEHFKATMMNLPEDFEFAPYVSVWSYKAAPLHKQDIQIDVFARAKDGYSLLGEVKNREKKKFSNKEAGEFYKKACEAIELEKIGKAVLFVFSAGGFTDDALDYMREKSIAWTGDKKWLDKIQ